MPAGPEDIVIEAENFQFMTYGWEIGESEKASAGCYIRMKEGVGDYESEAKIAHNPAVRSGDFYNITRDRRRIEARCYFMAPSGGRYFAAVRTMAHKNHCSNITFIRFNNGTQQTVGRNGTQPHVWLWHKIKEIQLNKGLNHLSFMAHQDDVKVDQVILSRKPLIMGERRTAVFTGGFQQSLPLTKDIKPVNLSLSTDTLAVTQNKKPHINVFIRKNTLEPIKAVLHLSIDLPDPAKRTETHTFNLPKNRGLSKFSYTIPFPEPLNKKEYLFRAELSIGSKPVQKRTLVLFHGYDWSVIGPLPYLKVTDQGSIEKNLRPDDGYLIKGDNFIWQKYREAFTDHFCLLDFKKMFLKEKKGPLEQVSLYAYTEVEAEEAGAYLLKVQGDDNIIVWINGIKIITIAEKGPPIRTARGQKIRLNKGRNRILFRLNQKKDQWQAGIRIRKEDDSVGNVKGIPFSTQNVNFYQ
jgi:hypothetical protein